MPDRAPAPEAVPTAPPATAALRDVAGPTPTARRARRACRARRRRVGALTLAAAVLAAGVVALSRVAPGARAAARGPTVGRSAGAAPDRSATAAPSTTAVPTTAAPTTPPPFQPPPVVVPGSPTGGTDGQWRVADPWAGGPPAVETTSFHPDPSQPSVVAYASWIRTSTTVLALYPGYEGPGPTPLDRGPEMVPSAGRSDLLATFNAGFYEADAPAGFFVHGTTYFPMRQGLATVVAYTDGRVDVVSWQGGATPGPGVAIARQNLALLVDGGAVVPSASVGSDWGLTLHGAPAVWRTGLGIDAHGDLLYVAAPDQTAASLGRILVELGAVRAMELDINPEWPIFVTYGAPGALQPTLDVPNPNQVPDRFLYPSTKDFFAVFRRVPGTTPQPW